MNFLFSLYDFFSGPHLQVYNFVQTIALIQETRTARTVFFVVAVRSSGLVLKRYETGLIEVIRFLKV